MENKHQSKDSDLIRFDAWLGSEEVSPPADLLLRIRRRLREGADPADELIDDLLRPNPALRNDFMLARVRRELAEPVSEVHARGNWFRWLTPLAAAATLAFAFFSFQSRTPRAWETNAGSQVSQLPPSTHELFDERTTEIFALASNLQGGTDLSKLESVEELAFLFD